MGLPPFKKVGQSFHLFRRLENFSTFLGGWSSLSTFVEGCSTTVIGGVNLFHLFRGLDTFFFLEVNDIKINS